MTPSRADDRWSSLRSAKTFNSHYGSCLILVPKDGDTDEKRNSRIDLYTDRIHGRRGLWEKSADHGTGALLFQTDRNRTDSNHRPVGLGAVIGFMIDNIYLPSTFRDFLRCISRFPDNRVHYGQYAHSRNAARRSNPDRAHESACCCSSSRIPQLC